MEEFRKSLEEMNLEQVIERMTQMEEEIRSAQDKDALVGFDEKIEALKERRAELEDLEKRKAEAEALANGSATPDRTLENSKGEERKMTAVELRESLDYGKAFLRGIKTNDFAECRKLMTENGAIGGDSLASATIPVPTFLESEIKTAWESYQIAGLVKKSYLKGNVKVVFEVSATGAVIHAEGTEAPAQEKVVLGSVTLTPANIKKWITVSDEALEGTTVDTINYLYKEIAQKIVEKAEEEIINNIVTAQVATDATHPGVIELAQNIAVDTILNAEALLSAMAKNINVVMNRQTYPAFVALALKAGYAIDVFDGLKDKIVFTDKLPAYGSAAKNAVYAIVGDFGYGYQANFPNGNDISIIKDELSLAEQDLVKLVGRQFVGHGVVAPKAFVKIKKVEEA